MALTLQMASGNDNLAVWCIRMKSEGTSLVTNGTFTTDGGWTVTSGDWIIQNGAAEHTYVDDAAGDLDYTVAAVSAVPYVLEYEITSITGTGFTLAIIGGGDGIIATTTTIPITVGQHRVILQGVSGKTLLRFHTAAFGAADVLFLDNVKLRKLEETTYLATETLALDVNTYDGQVLEFNDRISDVSSFIDTDSSGTIGGVASYQFTIARNSANTRFDGYFEEFYPTFLGGNLTSRDCEIGLVWNTATTDTEITWLMRGRIVDYRYTPRKMILTVLQSTEIDSRPLPHYSVQKDFDNAVSYFANAPEESLGATIPLAYGALDYTSALTGEYSYSPCVVTDKELNQVVVASHKLFAVTAIPNTSSLMRYIPSLKTYLNIYCANDSLSNTDIRAVYDLTNTPDEIYASLRIILRGQSILTSAGILPVTNVIDKDASNYTEVDATETLALTVDGNASTGEVGFLGVAADSCRLEFEVGSNDAGDRDWALNYDNRVLTSPPNIGTGTSGTITINNPLHGGIQYDFGGQVTSKGNGVLPWTIEEICAMDFFLTNSEAGAGDVIQVYWGMLELENIIITGITRKYIGFNLPLKGGGYHATILLPNITSVTRGANGGINFNTGEYYKSDLAGLFVRIKGREYGRWIDHILSADASKNRTMGDVEGDLIDCPPYIIESLFRDEVFVERDLQVTSSADTTHLVCDELISRGDDYYNYAEIFNATNELKRNVTDYVGATNTLAITADATPVAAGDNFYLTNIRGDNRIDYATFDAVGNTTNGTRKDWVFARSISTKEPLESLINGLCFESHCQVFETADEDAGYSKVKIVALDSGSGDTWATPAFRTGVESVVTSLTPLSSVFTSFKLFYYYDVGERDYTKSVFVDKNSYGGTGTLVDADQLLCKKAESTYNVTNPFSYSANWIYDDTTAELMLQKKIEWFTKQRLIVDWTSPLKNSATDYIKYELGDQVKLNYSQAIPTGLNNSSWFMITSKRIITIQGAPLIQWRLIEMG